MSSASDKINEFVKKERSGALAPRLKSEELKNLQLAALQAMLLEAKAQAK